MGFMGDDQTAMIKTDPLVNMGTWRAAKSELRKLTIVKTVKVDIFCIFVS